MSISFTVKQSLQPQQAREDGMRVPEVMKYLILKSKYLKHRKIHFILRASCLLLKVGSEKYFLNDFLP